MLPKRLIEVDLPIRRISDHARREKSIRHGHISTLHIWWARRPLAACRAVLCAALWPDPLDEACPPAFRAAAAQALVAFAEEARSDAKLANLCHRESWIRWNRTNAETFRPDDFGSRADLREALLDFIADFANWDAATVPAFLETGRALTQAAHEALGGLPHTRPLVVDPFAGGGAIPLEALRVGADAFASDLNPVAVLLNKVVLEYIPRYGQRLAEEVRRWGAWIKEQAEAELAAYYPPDPDGSTPIAYLWARTVRCEGPSCGAEVPLMRSLWLAKKAKRSVALRLLPDEKARRVDFEIIENPRARDVGEGTVRRGAATCPVCGYTTPVESVRRQLRPRRGGAADARLFCVVKTHPDSVGRAYRLPTERDRDAAQRAAEELARRRAAHDGPLSLVPEEPTPPKTGHRAVASVVLYGMEEWGDLFTPRQLLALTTLTRLVQQVGEQLGEHEESGLAGAVQTVLALAVDKQADLGNSLNRWEPVAECPRQLFARQAIPIVWDFAEGVPTGDSSGSFEVFIDGLTRALDRFGAEWSIGQVLKTSATKQGLPNEVAQAFITDPPYYDAVPYADLADFFYVWLRRTVQARHPELFHNLLTPKEEQIIVWHPQLKDEKREFEAKMGRALTEARRVLHPEGIGVVVFAHKTTAGWEAQLQAMIAAGWTITGSWPIDTEMGTRVNAMGTASLASSIHLVCRPRGGVGGGGVGDWRDVLQELPPRIRAWLPRLAREGVVGADAIFACLGPALEIFSRYDSVERTNGERVTLGEYLEHVWAAVAREALGMVFEGADTSGFEEDARLTAMWLWTLSAAASAAPAAPPAAEADEEEDDEGSSAPRGGSLGGFSLEYDAARKIAQGLGAHLEQLTTLVEVRGSRARLLPVAERAAPLLGRAGPLAATPRRRRPAQPSFFDLLGAEGSEVSQEWAIGEGAIPPARTVLDRVHQAMLLFAAGRGEALRHFLVDEAVGRDQRFWTLAQALSALYPSATDEKRWVDGVLARKRGLGF